MLTRSFDIEKRSTRWLLLAFAVSGCFYVTIVVAATLFHPTPAQRAEWPYGVAMVLFSAGVGCLALWLGIRSGRTELTEEGLVVPGWSGGTQVPWSEIARVRGHNLTLVLYDRAGRTYTLPWTVYRNPVDVKDFVKAHLHPSTRWDVNESR